eukprot:Sspe_Gene.3980::Locus_1328_Transcript_1_1_Confidence_1.000_Length_1725::g.3980::m.3980/K15633/gpmI; 2,3-bisphosphoglycerate-independent phosphoglycerate mutase
MDRYEADWGVVERGWRAHVLGEADRTFRGLKEAITTLREEGGAHASDQSLPPFVIVDDNGDPVGRIEDGDSVCIFNFRSDRVIEISKAFEYDTFDAFDRKRHPRVRFAGMMQYDGDQELPKHFLVPSPRVRRTSGEFLCKTGVRTFACAETRKFGHITFFWNGNRSEAIDSSLEKYHEVPSDTAPFDEAPQMKAREVTEAAITAVRSGDYDLVRVNYANADMVGHTGDLSAAITACEIVDECVGRLLDVTEEVGGRWLLTADHGNADNMVQREKDTHSPRRDPDSNRPLPCKSHTVAPVPVCFGGCLPDSIRFLDDSCFERRPGLANVTATFISLLGYKPPDFYEKSLI